MLIGAHSISGEGRWRWLTREHCQRRDQALSGEKRLAHPLLKSWTKALETLSWSFIIVPVAGYMLMCICCLSYTKIFHGFSVLETVCCFKTSCSVYCRLYFVACVTKVDLSNVYFHFKFEFIGHAQSCWKKQYAKDCIHNLSHHINLIGQAYTVCLQSLWVVLLKCFICLEELITI